MRFSRIALPAAMLAGIFGVTAGTAVAAGPCDAITQQGQRINEEQLVFTRQAYSDGTITPEEAAQAEAYSQAIARTTADLLKCIETGVVPPNYPPATPPADTQPPLVNTFTVPLAEWRLGSHALKITWDTAEPTRVSITFQRVSKGAKVTVGSIQAPPGASSISFRGKVVTPKLASYTLKPGAYLLTLHATDEAGNISLAKTEHLRVLPARH
jgi:hypothetical protein